MKIGIFALTSVTVICLTLLDIVALSYGIDGTVTQLTVASISSLTGGVIGYLWKGKKKHESGNIQGSA